MMPSKAVRFACICLAVAAASSRPAVGQQAARTAGGIAAPAPERLRFKLAPARCIVADVTIGPDSYPFVLDTGSSHNVYDRSMKKLLGAATENSRINSPLGGGVASLHEPIDARWGGLSLKTPDPVVCTDMGTFRRAKGLENAAGMIGMSFLKGYAVEIDFATATIALHEGGYAPDGSYDRIKMEFARGVPCVGGVVLAAGDRRFTLDTGFNQTLNLATECFDLAERSGGLKVRTRYEISDFFHKGSHRVGSLDRLTLGHTVVEGCETIEGIGIQNTIGICFLMKFDCVLDFPNSHLYLRARR